jgi:coenzyme Q-binding protein COQ10
VLLRPERIEVTSTDGPFRKFHLTWRFDPLPDNGCHVTLLFDLEMHSRTLQELFLRFLRGTAESILTAFEARAVRLYGPAERPNSPER